MKLTRPQRERLSLVAATTLWVILALVLVAPNGFSWSSPGPGAGTGTARTRYGLLHFLRTTRTDVALTGVRGPASTLRWQWRPLRLLGTVCLLVAATGASWLVYRKGVRDGALVGCCDACGYDLRGRRGARCPECGQPVTTSDDPDRAPEA